MESCPAAAWAWRDSAPGLLSHHLQLGPALPPGFSVKWSEVKGFVGHVVP